MNNPIEKLTLKELLELELNISKNFALQKVANENGDLEVVSDYTKHHKVYQDFLKYLSENKIKIYGHEFDFTMTYGEIAEILIHQEVIKKKNELQESHEKEK